MLKYTYFNNFIFLYFICIFTRFAKNNNFASSRLYVNLHVLCKTPLLTRAFCEVKFDFLMKKDDLYVNLHVNGAVKSHRKNTCFLNDGARRLRTPARAWFIYKEHTPPHRGLGGWVGGGGGLAGWFASWLAGWLG